MDDVSSAPTVQTLAAQMKAEAVVASMRAQHMDEKVGNLHERLDRLEISVAAGFRTVSNRLWTAAGGFLLFSFAVSGWVIAEYLKLRGH